MARRGFLSSVGQSVRLLTSRSGVRTSQGAYVAFPSTQGPRTFIARCQTMMGKRRDNLGSNPSVGVLEQAWKRFAKAGGILAPWNRFRKPPMGFGPMTSRLLSGCSAN